MGAFFTNVQVRVMDGRGRARLIDGLRAAAITAGFVEVADGAAPDRVVMVGPIEDGWVTLCDQATESQDSRALDELATTASAAIGGHAVSVLLHDGDVLQLALFEGGRVIDRYDSAPSYFGRVDAGTRRRAAGDPERWGPVLANGTTGDLRAAWTDRDLYGEGVLQRTADLLGIVRRRARRCYRHVAADDDERAAFDVLRFRLAERPAYEREVEGPPRLSAYEGTASFEGTVGEAFELSATARNHGGRARGLEITIFGDALEHGLVQVERLERYGRRGETLYREEVPLGPAPERPGVLCAVGDWEMGAGHVITPQDWLRFDSDTLFELQRSSEVSFTLHMRALAAGVGTMNIRFTPLAAARGRRTRKMKVTVRDTKRSSR